MAKNTVLTPAPPPSTQGSPGFHKRALPLVSPTSAPPTMSTRQRPRGTVNPVTPSKDRTNGPVPGQS